MEVKRSKGSDEEPLTGVVSVPEEAVSPPRRCGARIRRQFAVLWPSQRQVEKEVECFATRVVARYRGL